MSETFRPDTEEQLREAIAWAASETAPLDVVGTGTKSGIGRAMQTRARLDLSGLSGITLYEPEELVLSAGAGTLASKVEAELEARGQAFAFEPPDLSGLLGSAHAGTLGGMVAANLSGPRRLKAGAVRDHLLGFRAVSGRGEIFQSGSRVMKNVTGYDLSKVMAGSWGTLAALSQVTFKVLPAPETQASVVVSGLDAHAGARAMSAAMQSSHEVSSAAFVPASLAQGIDGLPDGTVCALRLEGFAPSVAARTRGLKDVLGEFGELNVIDTGSSKRFWRAVRDVAFLAHDDRRIVWRISVPPMNGPGVLETVLAIDDARGFMDWAGGLIWADMPVSAHGSAQLVRGAIAGCGGHATLIRAPQTLRAAIAVFEPQPAGLAALSARLKNSFDPKGILNPGRMYS